MEAVAMVSFPRIRKARTEAGLSLQQLARKSGVSAQRIFEYETGIAEVKVTLFGRGICRVAHALGLKIAEVVKGK